MRREVKESMDKKYTEFMDEISPDELYEGLLAYGFSPKNFRLYSPLSLSMIIAKPYLTRLNRDGMNT